MTVTWPDGREQFVLPLTLDTWRSAVPAWFWWEEGVSWAACWFEVEV